MELSDGTADDLPLDSAGDYVAALAIFADASSKFLIPNPTFLLSAGAAPATPGSPFPQDSPDPKMITLYSLKWDFSRKAGEVQIWCFDNSSVTLPFRDGAQFTATCMTLRIPGRTAYLDRDKRITTARPSQ